MNEVDRFGRVYEKMICNYENEWICGSEGLSELERLYDERNGFNNWLEDGLGGSELWEKNYRLVYNILEKSGVYSYKLNESVGESIVMMKEGS